MENDRETETLRQSILAHDKEFQDLMCMIPAKYYIPQQHHVVSWSDNSSFGQKNRKKKNKKEKLAAAEAKRALKRAKYDPEMLPTIPQLQCLNSCSESKSVVSPRMRPPPDGSEDTDDDGEDQQPPCSRPQLSHAELQEKLRQRIDKLQGSSSKMVTVTHGGPGLTSKDALLALGRQKRGEMRDRRRKERKEALRKEKQLKQEQLLLEKKKKGLLTSHSRSATGSGSGNLKKGDEANAKAQAAEDVPVAKATTIPNKSHEDESSQQQPKQAVPNLAGCSQSNPSEPRAQELDIAYSALSFDIKASSAADGQPSRGHKNPTWTSKNPLEAKIALDRRQAYLEKLTPEARERAEEKKKWEKANLQASGTKVMDDPKKVEKALKRQTKEKRKRRDAWEERTKMVEKVQDDRQKKRRENIEKRKEQIRDKRKGVKAKGNSKSKLPKKSVKGF